MLQRLFRDQYGQHPEFDRVTRGQTYHRQPSLAEIEELSARMRFAVEQGGSALSVLEEFKRKNPHYNSTLRPVTVLATQTHVIKDDGIILFPRHF
jgi:hypothetical protein